MAVSDLLPWLNLLLVPAVALLVRLENRLTRLEGLGPRVHNLEAVVFHRRASDTLED